MKKQMKHKQILKENSFADLHESIIINILVFLPIQCITRCRCVCKNWATLIAQPYFIKRYDSTKKPALIQLLLEDRSNSMKPNNLFLGQLDDDAACTTNSPADFVILNKTRFPLKFLDDLSNPCSYLLKVFSTSSVTGCVAAYRYDGKESTPFISCHIFNPVTGQNILVDDNTNGYRWDYCALLYVEKMNQYKFLYFHGWSNNMDQVEVDIQRIGSNSWRSMGRIPFYPTQQSLPTFVNGLYHWIDPRKHVIYSFNAEEEVFQKIQTPPPRTGCCYRSSDLGLINGCLCICVRSIKSRIESNTELWVMSEAGDGKSWTKNFVLGCLGPDRTLQPLKCLENGDVLILGSPRNAICCNPTTRSRKYIRFAEKESIRYRAFSFIPSLRSVVPADST